MQIEVYESLAGQWRWRFRNGQRVTEIYHAEESKARATTVAKDLTCAIVRAVDPNRRVEFKAPRWSELGHWIIELDFPRPGAGRGRLVQIQH
jgi:hypothetical protein